MRNTNPSSDLGWQAMKIRKSRKVQKMGELAPENQRENCV